MRIRQQSVLNAVRRRQERWRFRLKEMSSERFNKVFIEEMEGKRLRPFHYRRSFMYAAVRIISYIAECDASWEKESGSVAKLWASNIRFGYCAILTVT